MATPIALLAQLPDIDPAKAIGSAEKIKSLQAETAEQYTKNRLADLQLGEYEGSRSALANYNKTKKLSDLDMYPEMKAQMIKMRGAMDAQSRASYDAQVMKNAEAANRVLSVPEGIERNALWQSELNLARKEGRLDQERYDAFLKMGPRTDLLTNLRNSVIPLKEMIKMEMEHKQRLDLQRKKADTTGSSGQTKSYREKYNSALGIGLDENTAAAYASGILKLDKDPISGEPRVVNKATGQTIKVDPGKAKALEQEEQANKGLKNISFKTGEIQGNARQTQNVSDINQSLKPQRTLWDQADNATGLWNTLPAAASSITEQIPIIGTQVVSKETRQAMTDFQMSQKELAKNLANNDKYPVWEQKQDMGLLTTGAFRTPESLRDAMTVVDENMRARRQMKQEIFEDQSFPAKERQKAKVAIREIDKFLTKLGVPQQQEQPSQGQSNIPGGAIQFLKDNAKDPAIIQQFEEKYGTGSARQILGQ